METNAQETPIADYPRGITFEQVWAALMETKALVQENAQQQKETDRRLGHLGNSIGGLVETLVAARLWEKFSSYNYGFKRAYRRVQIFDDVTNKELTDIDILLSDTEWVMAVEVKRDVALKDVERHIVRMKRIREHPPAEARGKKLLGAMAGGTFDSEARDFAHESGFFVLELRGEAVDLIPPPENFSPTEW